MTPSRSEVDDLAENEQVFGVLLALHGGVHLLGAAISWRVLELNNFQYEDVWPSPGTVPAGLAGVAWLVAAGWLGLVGARLALRRPVTRRQLAAPLVLSVIVTSTALPAALPGTAVSAAALLAMTVLAVRRGRISP